MFVLNLIFKCIPDLRHQWPQSIVTDHGASIPQDESLPPQEQELGQVTGQFTSAWTRIQDAFSCTCCAYYVVKIVLFKCLLEMFLFSKIVKFWNLFIMFKFEEKITKYFNMTQLLPIAWNMFYMWAMKKPLNMSVLWCYRTRGVANRLHQHWQ